MGCQDVYAAHGLATHGRTGSEPKTRHAKHPPRTARQTTRTTRNGNGNGDGVGAGHANIHDERSADAE
eukprot:14273634-Alexandrium_andersonii.AAC.1